LTNLERGCMKGIIYRLEIISIAAEMRIMQDSSLRTHVRGKQRCIIRQHGASKDLGRWHCGGDSYPIAEKMRTDSARNKAEGKSCKKLQILGIGTRRGLDPSPSCRIHDENQAPHHLSSALLVHSAFNSSTSPCREQPPIFDRIAWQRQ
jgi:hypothetical protein